MTKTRTTHNRKVKVPAPRKLTKKDLRYFEQLLLEQKRQILRQRDFTDAQLSAAERSTDAAFINNPYDLGDQGYDTYQREIASKMTSDQTRVLHEIDEALSRVALGTYGNCESCGKPIPKARLELVPQCRYCVACMRNQERVAPRKSFRHRR